MTRAINKASETKRLAKDIEFLRIVEEWECTYGRQAREKKCSDHHQ